MDIKKNFEKLTDDVQQYIDLKTDNIKLQVVENISLFCCDLLSYAVISVLAFLIIFFLLLAGLILLAPVIGLLQSLLAIATLLAIISAVVYYARKRLFANTIVIRFCRMFFPNDNKDE